MVHELWEDAIIVGERTTRKADRVVTCHLPVDRFTWRQEYRRVRRASNSTSPAAVWCRMVSHGWRHSWMTMIGCLCRRSLAGSSRCRGGVAS